MKNVLRIFQQIAACQAVSMHAVLILKGETVAFSKEQCLVHLVTGRKKPAISRCSLLNDLQKTRRINFKEKPFEKKQNGWSVFEYQISG